MSDNFKLPDELLGGAVKVIRPTDLRNRVGMYMMEERGVKMGCNVDPGDVQDMIVEFTQREIEKAGTGDALLDIATTCSRKDLRLRAEMHLRERSAPAEPREAGE